MHQSKVHICTHSYSTYRCSAISACTEHVIIRYVALIAALCENLIDHRLIMMYTVTDVASCIMYSIINCKQITNATISMQAGHREWEGCMHAASLITRVYQAATGFSDLPSLHLSPPSPPSPLPIHPQPLPPPTTNHLVPGGRQQIH